MHYQWILCSRALPGTHAHGRACTVACVPQVAYAPRARARYRTHLVIRIPGCAYTQGFMCLVRAHAFQDKPGHVHLIVSVAGHACTHGSMHTKACVPEHVALGAHAPSHGTHPITCTHKGACGLVCACGARQVRPQEYAILSAYTIFGACATMDMCNSWCTRGSAVLSHALISMCRVPNKGRGSVPPVHWSACPIVGALIRGAHMLGVHRDNSGPCCFLSCAIYNFVIY